MKETEIKQKGIPEVDIIGRILPQAIDAEEAVLGAILLQTDVYGRIEDSISESCFYKEANRIIFNSVKELSDSNTPIDMLSVVAKLRSKKQLELVGGTYYVATLTNKVVSTANVEYHARIIKEKEIARRIIELGNAMMRDAYDDGSDALELVSRYGKEIAEIPISSASSVITIKEGLTQVLRNAVENKTNSKKSSGFLTGFRYFDDKSGGFQPSDLVVIAGETSMGKTSLALNIAKNIAEVGTPIAFYSREMSTIQLCARLTAAASDIPSSDILYSKLDDACFNTVSYGIAKLENLPIFIDDGGTSDIGRIISSIRQMVLKFGVKVVFIDYLQLLSSKGNGYNRELEIGGMANRLKEIAKSLNICIVILSQFSRDKEPYPTLSRLRDSGQIEQAADTVIFIYRHEHYGNLSNFPKQYPTIFRNKETVGYALIDVAKGRNIGVFKFLCGFNAPTTNFKDVHIDNIPNRSSMPTALVKNGTEENIPF